MFIIIIIIISSSSSSSTVAAAVDYLSGCNMITCLFLNCRKEAYILTTKLNQRWDGS
jgi:hypothetical protein